MALRTICCCLLLVLAGCSGVLSGGAGTPTGTFTPAPVSPTTTPTAGATPTYTATVDLAAFRAPSVRVVAIDHETNRTVVNETHEGEFDVTYGETAFEADRAYDIVLYVEGESAWNRTLQAYEAYELRVEEDGTVTVTGHSTA